MTRTHARSPKGTRAHGKVPRNRGSVITVIGALTLDGLVATMTIDRGTSGDVFLAYVEQVLSPHLRPGDYVVMDNLAAHKDERVKRAIESTGAMPVYQPPYSPDLNPIELAWSWLKAFMKTAQARTRSALDTAVSWGMDMISHQQAKAWFRHCGFTNQQN